MNESSKTIAFVSAAAMMVALAFTSHYLNRPKTGKEFELVGQPFYEDFVSSEQANSLEVAAIDNENLRLQRFSVKNEDGLWRIPSHHDYPAEAAARLATTATSVMGIERESLAGRLASEHEKLGVVDPLGEDIEDPESVGKRITLKDSDGEVVVDFIIGKEAGEVEVAEVDRPFSNNQNPVKFYYIRRPDEQQTYKVKLDVDLSTRFSDWIDPDLLRLDRSKLNRILIDDYSLQEQRGNPLGDVQSLLKVQGDQLNLSRQSSTDPWTLAEIDEKKEELKNDRINEMIDTLGEIRIAGVRPKTKYKNYVLLTPELELNRQPEFEQDPQGYRRAINQLQDDLDEKGFNLAGSAEKLELVSQEGQVQVGTEDGVLYTLQFGKEVEGEDKAIEIGDASRTSETEDKDDELTATNGDEKSESDPVADADEEPEPSKNSYLMIRVSFDETLLGDRPTKPEEPVKPTVPEGYVAPSPPDEATDAADPGSQAGDEQATDEDAAPKPEEPERNPEFAKYDEDLAAYEQAKIEYELALSRFGNDVKEFKSKVEEGKKLVDELNERFGDWYYVISANNLKSLKTNRADLVAEKEIPEDRKIPPKPDISFPKSDLDSPATPGESSEGNPSGEAAPAGEDSAPEGDGKNQSNQSESG